MSTCKHEKTVAEQVAYGTCENCWANRQTANRAGAIRATDLARLFNRRRPVGESVRGVKKPGTPRPATSRS